MLFYYGKWRNVILVVLTVAALALTSCGQTSSKGQAPKSPSQQASGSQDGNLMLNVGQISDSIAFFPLFVAEEQGFFTAEGLTLGERPRLGTGAKLGAALVAGSIDVAAGVITDAFALAEAGKSPVIVGSLVNNYYVDIVAGSKFLQDTGLKKDSPLDAKIRALKGRKIGITGPGSGTEALVVYLFKLVGLNPQRDAELVNLGSDMSAALAALRAGRVDVLSFFQPIGQLAEVEGIGQVLIQPGRDVPNMAGQVHGVVFTTAEVLKEKRDAVEAFVRGLARAEKFIHDNPEQTKELLAKYLSGFKPEALDAIMAVMKDQMAVNPGISQNSYEKAVKFHVDSGLIKEPVSYEAIVGVETIQKATTN